MLRREGGVADAKPKRHDDDDDDNDETTTTTTTPRWHSRVPRRAPRAVEAPPRAGGSATSEAAAESRSE